MVVATDASQLDVDVFGADLGLSVPVVAFQVKKLGAECCMAYQIYSLQKPPRLLRSITGGSSFSASDTDLDGRVEIWTDDAAAVDGFEDFVIGEFDFAPTIVLRFQHGRLLDVTSEFRPYVDREIAKLHGELDAQDLRDFKDSDCKLVPSASRSAKQLHQLRGMKIKVLEIVWSYLYSGREAEAWHSLAEMWPAGDVARVRGELLKRRARGIHSQVDATFPDVPHGRQKKAVVFDAVSRSEGGKSDVTPPQPILMRRPAPFAAEQGLADSELLLNLVIDSAGKVRSVEPVGSTKSADADLLKAALGWTFVPAFKDDHPVASRMRLAVSAKR
jgi:hypothetical protein